LLGDLGLLAIESSLFQGRLCAMGKQNMTITPIQSREVKPEYNMPFVPAFLVQSSKLLFLAGCGPIPPYHKHPHVPEEEAQWMSGGIREQATKTFEHLEELLRAAGADLFNIVKLTIYLRNIADQNAFNEISAKVFANGSAPPRTVIQAVLNHEDMLLEVDAIAAL
jgi:2-iminobutanoate/2-iminopropanoate deaminase